MFSYHHKTLLKIRLLTRSFVKRAYLSKNNNIHQIKLENIKDVDLHNSKCQILQEINSHVESKVNENSDEIGQYNRIMINEMVNPHSSNQSDMDVSINKGIQCQMRSPVKLNVQPSTSDLNFGVNVLKSNGSLSKTTSSVVSNKNIPILYLAYALLFSFYLYYIYIYLIL